MDTRLLVVCASTLVLAGCTSSPTITQVRLSRSSILDTQSARINLTVNDENGLDDLVGAHLYSGDGSYWFGSFAEVSDGIFEIAIDWGMLNDASPIYFDFPITREFTVIVEDNEGEYDRVQVFINLTCRANQHACDGACYPDDLNCDDI